MTMRWVYINLKQWSLQISDKAIHQLKSVSTESLLDKSPYVISANFYIVWIIALERSLKQLL